MFARCHAARPPQRRVIAQGTGPPGKALRQAVASTLARAAIRLRPWTDGKDGMRGMPDAVRLVPRRRLDVYMQLTGGSELQP